ncbi:MAG: hypothetical protein QM749_06680 [Aquabacterium sp.]
MLVLSHRITLLVAGACLVSSAWAQSDDPPSVVAWLGQTQGGVSFAPAGTDTWAYASPNRPLTTGDQLWVDKGGRAELHVGSTALRLGAQSEVAVTSLSDSNMQWRVSQGSVQLRIRTLYPDQRVEIDTPNLAFVPSSPGNYRIDVDPASGTTRITNWSGGGTVYGNTGTSEAIPAPDRVTYSGTGLDRRDASPTPSADELDRWAQARDDAESRSATARYVSRETTGYAALDGNGTWTNDPAYGAVWVPTAVATDWAPYHYGHWAWIDPWGWTWVDDAPWGFAPFHYGRWAWLPGRSHWGWVPGPVAVARPVYAPALVAFVSGGGGGTHWGGGAEQRRAGRGLAAFGARRGLHAGLPREPALCDAHQPDHRRAQHDREQRVREPAGPACRGGRARQCLRARAAHPWLGRQRAGGRDQACAFRANGGHRACRAEPPGRGPQGAFASRCQSGRGAGAAFGGAASRNPARGAS